MTGSDPQLGSGVPLDASVQAVQRLLLRKGELEADDQHPLFQSGLTVTQLKVLFAATRRGVRPSAIADRARMAAPNLTSVLDRLSERGLIYRAPDPDDGRATIVLLTHEGKRLVRAIAAAYQDQWVTVLGRLDDDELVALERGLAALVREMESGGGLGGVVTAGQ